MKLKQTLLTYWILGFVLTIAKAQDPIWYDYSLTYYKIPTAQDGIYRISAEALQASGINLEGLDPRMIRVFHRGKEVAIHVEGENDGKVDPQDFIDFYGIRNDAELDKKNFIPNSPLSQIHTIIPIRIPRHFFSDCNSRHTGQADGPKVSSCFQSRTSGQL